MTWAHGTSGMADVCAPSKQSDIASRERVHDGPCRVWHHDPYVQTFLDAGYVVSATDYEGIGTPGLHRFSWATGRGAGACSTQPAPHTI